MKSEYDEEAELFSGAPLRGHVPVIMKLTGSSNNTKTVVTEKIDIRNPSPRSRSEHSERSE